MWFWTYVNKFKWICILGWNCIGTWRNTSPSYTSAGEKVFGDSVIASARQCQNCGSHFTSRCNDWPDNGRSFSYRGYPAADCSDEHAYWSFDYQQHHVYIPLLACLLHKSLPDPDNSILFRISFSFMFPVINILYQHLNQEANN